ncbi:hypothetical protein DFH11DRAFT_1605600 [Phellopilus nigrolimitatus]|nr:hypothetical protein DFH11DRAFT_1605600 [Phellopilus nigrolimitatus]
MRTSTPSTGDPFSSSLDDLDSVYTLVSTSSSRTASNLPGAGRVLGNLISSLGRILERLFSRFAEGMGMGPRAVARKIELHHSLCCVRGESANNRHPPSARQARKLRKDCQRLVGYLQSDVLSTQLEALVYISCLATMHLSLQQTFRDCNSVATLRAFFARLETAPYTAATREEFGRLRVSARRCIVCVDDNEINRLSRGFRQTIYTAGWVQYVEKLSVRAKSW